MSHFLLCELLDHQALNKKPHLSAPVHISVQRSEWLPSDGEKVGNRQEENGNREGKNWKREETNRF